MLVVPLYRAFGSEAGQDIFIDALAYLGVMQIPVLKPHWPETAGLAASTKPSSLLRASSSSAPGYLPN